MRVGNPITVEPKAGGKYRMCVDARWTNAHTPKPYFKLETPAQALPETVRKGDRMITTDIAKAYYAVPIADEIGPYLAVEFDGKWYIPRVLPFGHSLAYVFNKIVRQTVAVSRVLGVRVYNYFDDYLWMMEKGEETATVGWARFLLQRLGWSTNMKCVWEPSTEADFMGLLIPRHSL